MDQTHRKRIKHYEEFRQVHELTFSCVARRPLLTNDDWRAWFCELLDAACARHGFHILAYVLMPEHVHLLVYPSTSAARIANLLTDVKRPFSRRVKRDLATKANPLLQQLTIRQRPGVETFRFWQEGPGYDRNLTELKAVIAAIDYIHANPVRRGLCDRTVDWPWSSARRLLLDGPLDVVPRLSRFDPQLFEVRSSVDG